MADEVNGTVKNGLRMCYGSCCHDLQREEQHREHALIQRLDKYRHQAIEAKNGSAGKRCLYKSDSRGRTSQSPSALAIGQGQPYGGSMASTCGSTGQLA